MATPYRWNPDKRDRDGGKPLLKSLKANGAVCCASTDPDHMCPDCKARRGRTTDNALVTNAETVNEWGLTANEMVDVCDASMEMTRRAGEASDKAAQSRDPADHGAAADEHDNAEEWHDSAADERTGTAATVHSQFARDHHMMAEQHRATGDFLARPEEPPAANDYEDDGDDSSDATQNQNHQPPRRRTTMTTRRPGQATQYLAQLRSQGVGGRALEQIENRLRHQTMTHNCDCHGRRRNEETDALVPPTMNQILGIGGPEPTTNSRMPGRNELVYDGFVEGDEPGDVMTMPRLNYDRLTVNVTGRVSGSAAGLSSGHAISGGRGYLRTAEDARNIPGFDIQASMDRNFADDGNTGAYPKDGYREIAPLTSGRPRVKSTLGPPESGGNVGSYPRQGTRGDQGSTDSAGDDYEDGRGSRSDRGKSSGGYYPTSGPAAQYDAPMEHVDRGDLERGQVHAAGMSNAIYAADYWRRMTPGGIGEGANGLPQDADGQDYRRSPTQDEDDFRRRFGSQKKRPTANVETDALIPPTIDWREQSATWAKGASR